jgi:serine/threonine-protein kinase
VARVNQGQHKRKERSPWTWPLISLIALLVIVTAGTVVAVVLG